MSEKSLCFVWPLLICLCVAYSRGAAAQCGDLANDSGLGYQVGPYDYRAPNQRALKLVEAFHFTPEVERLERGHTAVTPGPDLSFALRVFPNHPRALLAMINLGFKTKTDKPAGSDYTVACWLDRAERFQPDDGTVQLLYGIYFLRKGQPQAAVSRLENAEKLSGESANVHYNLGLAYFDLRDYDQALAHAQRAYRLGFPLPGLRDKLKGVGKWRPDPNPTGSPPTAAEDRAAPPTSKPEASGSSDSPRPRD